MKHLVIGSVAVALLVSASFVYKHNNRQIIAGFPLPHQAEGKAANPFHLIYFFSIHNCPACLEVIKTLNNLPPHFTITGVVPLGQLANPKKTQEITGAEFPLISQNDLKKYTPAYWPCLMGVDKQNNLCFILPSLPDQNNYLEDFLQSFYYKYYQGQFE